MNIEKMTTTLQEAIAEAQQIAVTENIKISTLPMYGKSFYNLIILVEISIRMPDWMSNLLNMKLIVYWMSIQLFLVETSNMDKTSARISFDY